MSRLRWDHIQGRRSTPTIIIVASLAVLVACAAILVGDPAVTRHDALTYRRPGLRDRGARSGRSAGRHHPLGDGHDPNVLPGRRGRRHAELASDTPVTRSAPIVGDPLPLTGPTPGDCAAWAAVFLALHGLTTRVDTDNPAWAAACLTLYRVCGTGPWRPPYSCDNRRLPS